MNCIILGADGKLYFSSYDESFIGTVANSQIVLNRTVPGENLATDFTFWAKHITKTVFFEEGLTLRKFFECLMPWQEFFSLQTQVDLLAYYKEMQEPQIESQKENHTLDYLVLSKTVSFNPYREIAMHEDEPLEENDERLYELSDGYYLSGFNYGEETAYDISHTRMQYIADIPVILNPHGFISYGDYLPGGKRVKRGEATIKMDENIFGFRKTTEKTPFIKTSELEVSLEEMLRSFFRYIFSTPHKRDFGSRISINMAEGTACISEPLNSLEEAKKQAEHTADLFSFPNRKNLSTENESKSENTKDNVIPVEFGKKKIEKETPASISSGLISNITELLSAIGGEHQNMGLIKMIDFGDNPAPKVIESLASVPEPRAASWGFEKIDKEVK